MDITKIKLPAMTPINNPKNKAKVIDLTTLILVFLPK